MRTCARALVLAALIFLGVPEVPNAQSEFPNRPITIIVPWTAGGITDSVTRLIAEELRTTLGQPIIVENKPGAGGRIGSEFVSRAPPDGHTILFATTSSQTLPALSKNPPYDPLKAWDPLILLNSTAGALVSSPVFPPNSVHELIAWAKANPRKLNCATIGLGSTSHLSCEMLRMLAEIDLTLVPYKGESQVINDLLSGQVQIYFMISARPYVDNRQVKLMGAMSLERTAVNPDWPTLHELGIRGFERSGWQGLMLPPGTPRPVVEKLNTAVNAALKLPHVRQKIIDFGLEPQGGTPEVLRERMAEELRKARALVSTLKIEIP